VHALQSLAKKNFTVYFSVLSVNILFVDEEQKTDKINK
jgi:hypothetical protein